MLASLVGMIGSSVGVSWVMGPPASAAVAPAPAFVGVEVPAGAPAAAPSDPAPASPTFVADGVLRVEGRVGHSVLPAGKSQETFVMLDVSAMKADGVESRAPVDVAIVLDRSASMRGRRMGNAIAGVRGMLAQLRPDDTVSIVAYSDRASLLLPPSRMRSLDLAKVSTMLDRVRAGGHTCISCGIELARAQLRSHEGAVSRMLLLSDGQANRGIVDPSGFRVLADAVRRDRAAIASIGVDIDYDERTLFALSEASNGRHYFVQDPRGLAAVFDDERRALVGTVADRADVSITL
ncbi:MAG TPA: VWA domain-containing protein, partial [Nannocystaceae bacterium]|nr:VWA domain-containing protein [Nannocystaceae bacterium]